MSDSLHRQMGQGQPRQACLVISGGRAQRSWWGQPWPSAPTDLCARVSGQCGDTQVTGGHSLLSRRRGGACALRDHQGKDPGGGCGPGGLGFCPGCHALHPACCPGCGAGGSKMPPVPRPRGRGRAVSDEAVTSPPPATLRASPARWLQPWEHRPRRVGAGEALTWKAANHMSQSRRWW